MSTSRIFTTLALATSTLTAQAQTFLATSPALPVTVPDGLTTGSVCSGPGVIDVSIPVAGVTTALGAISVSVDVASTWGGDAVIELIAPGEAAQMPLVGRVGKTTATGIGYDADFVGTYVFVDPAVSPNNIWTAATGSHIAPGTYATTTVGAAGVPNPAPTTPFLATFSSLSAAQLNGTWTLRVSDCASGDRITVSAASLTLGASAPPATAVNPVPTLGTWAVLALGGLLGWLGLRRARRSTR